MARFLPDGTLDTTFGNERHGVLLAVAYPIFAWWSLTRPEAKQWLEDRAKETGDQSSARLG